MINEQFSNKSISQLLHNIAAAQLLKGHNRFRIIAYEKAADAIESLSRELYDVWKEGKILRVSGIGANIGNGLSEYFEKGESQHFDSITEGIPPTVFLLMTVPGIGPKKAFKLVMHFKLINEKTVVEDLKKIAQEGRIAQLEGFGDKSEQDILSSLTVFERRDRQEERMILPSALKIADEITTYMKQHPLVTRVDVLGSLRRKVSTIGDIDIAVCVDEKSYSKRVCPDYYKQIVDHFLAYPGKRSVEAAGDQKASILAAGNMRIDMRVQPESTYGSMLQYFTGSKSHNIQLREYALSKKLSLSEHGIKDMKIHPPSSGHPLHEGGPTIDLPLEGSTPKGGGVSHTFKTEEDLYAFLGLQTPAPEIREGNGEIELAKHHKLPTLVDLPDIRGDFHMHSEYDLKPSHDRGANTYQDMMKKGQELGYKYIGFSEHNPKQKGLSDEDIIAIMKKRKEHIDNIFTPHDLPYFIGLEVDILPSGEIALPTEAIEYVDYLIVSLHSSFRMNRVEMTKRVLKALSQPKVKIFGHPTGRLLGKRDGVELDWDKVFSYVLEHNQALEINSGPPRLDLPDLLVKEGKEQGVKFIINTDAHAVEQMDWMTHGVSVARRGWLEAKDVVNTWELPKFKKWILG
ncbi:MAG: PHP domain-containing protein [bacterium]|nr:PHP domain-containing protein [bacterium]